MVNANEHNAYVTTRFRLYIWRYTSLVVQERLLIFISWWICTVEGIIMPAKAFEKKSTRNLNPTNAKDSCKISHYYIFSDSLPILFSSTSFQRVQRNKLRKIYNHPHKTHLFPLNLCWNCRSSSLSITCCNYYFAFQAHAENLFQETLTEDHIHV